MRKITIAATLVAALGVVGWPGRARGEEGVQPDRGVAVGGKLGIIPPIFTVAELVVRPAPHLAVGIFGIVTPAVGLGNGGTRTSVGGELIYEFGEGRRGGPYLSLAYGYYHAALDAAGFYETSHTAYTTAGYVWKFRSVELYCGGGFLLRLVDETPPCTEFCIIDVPPLLPAIEMGLRFGFL